MFQDAYLPFLALQLVLKLPATKSKDIKEILFDIKCYDSLYAYQFANFDLDGNRNLTNVYLSLHFSTFSF